MPENQHHHPEGTDGSQGQPSWVPPPNPYYSATEPPRKSGTGKKVLIGVLVALALVVAVGIAGVAIFLADSSRATSHAAGSTVVQTVTEFVDPPVEEPARPEAP